MDSSRRSCSNDSSDAGLPAGYHPRLGSFDESGIAGTLRWILWSLVWRTVAEQRLISNGPNDRSRCGNDPRANQSPGRGLSLCLPVWPFCKCKGPTRNEVDERNEGQDCPQWREPYPAERPIG